MTTQEAVTPLYNAHLKLNGKMVPFAGYLLPVQYQSIIKEAEAVRNGAGMFDVSHMARLRFTGSDVLEFLEHVTVNDVALLPVGHGHYSFLPNADGGVVDDIILYHVGPNEYAMVVNAANHAKDVAWLKQNMTGRDVVMVDETEATAMIAVQGPTAGSIVASLSNNPTEFEGAEFFQFVEGKVGGVDCFAARSGYTGEDGFELICAGNSAEQLWDALLGAGVVPCGLGSRDTLRVEAGLPLYGHELTDDRNPITAGLGWVVAKEKAEFLGSGPIRRAMEDGTSDRLVGVKLQSRRLPQPEMTVLVNGEPAGTVSSGVYSPLLECGIGFAFVDIKHKFGTECTVDVRGTQEPGTIVNKRFFKRAK